jgi:hypothetical protein
MVTDEEEVVGSILYPSKIANGDDIPTKDITQDLGRHSRYVQQRISGAFELNDVSCAFFDLFLQG